MESEKQEKFNNEENLPKLNESTEEEHNEKIEKKQEVIQKKKKNKSFLLGFIIVGICLIVGMGIGINIMENTNNNSNNNYYNSSSSSIDNQKDQAKSKFIRTLEDNGYVKESSTKYIKQGYDDSCNDTEEIYFNSKMYSNKILCKNDDGSYLENSSNYYWDKEVISGSSQVYYYYSNSRNLVSSLTYSMDAYNNFSCSGNSYECEYVKATVPLFKSHFTYLINEAGISLRDLN